MKNHARKEAADRNLLPLSGSHPLCAFSMLEYFEGGKVTAKVKIWGSHLHQVKCVTFHLHAKLNCSRADWKLPVCTMLSIAASIPAFRGAEGCGCWGGGVETSSCSSTSSLATAVPALFLPLRFLSARSCLAVLDLVCVGARVGVGAGVGSGAGVVTGGGVGGISTTGGSGGMT